MPKIIGNPEAKNIELRKLIQKTKLNNFYIKNHSNFREEILKQINLEDDVLDIGKSMREKFSKIKSKSLETLDVNLFQDYPDIVFDLSDEFDNSLENKYDKIICLAILEHVYDPFKAIINIRKMLKKNGTVFGYVPFLYQYHAPNDLKFQDYFRFSKDGLSYLFKEFSQVELFPIRGRISTPLQIFFSTKWKKYVERFKLNILLDKFISDKKNSEQCSGYNFILKR
tara:strand:+ start:1218 stop:1895 length:678 start_codon:yes stop_codon:yes gene_type:complete